MATEPERDIEKALRAVARRRREQPGAPVEIHPATRRLLQGEVARQKGRGQPGAGFWPKLLWGSWPRLAFNVSLLIAFLLAAGVWLLPAFRTGQNPSASANMRLAENDHAKADSPALRDDYKKSLPSAAPALKKEAQNEPRSATAEFDQPGKDKVYNRLSAANQNKLADQSSTNSASPGLRADASAAPAQPAAPPPAVPSSSTIAPALDQEFARRQVASPPAVVSQQFTRVNQSVDSVALQSAQTSPAPRVLDSFRVEQTGSQLRVIDSDGSVYTGFLGETNTVAEDSLARREAAADESAKSDEAKQSQQALAQAPSGGTVVSGKLPESAPTQNTQSGQTYFFRVSGTNISLNQPVVLTGNFYQTAANTRGSGGRGGAAPAQASRNRAAAPSLAGAPQPAATNGPVPLPLSNLRLQGRALVGTNQVEITALPEKK